MELLNYAETAQRLGLGTSLTKELVYKGEIESVKIGKRRLMPSAAVDTYIARLREEQGAERESVGA